MQKIFFTDALFKDVQLQKVFPDGKTFVDCEPILSLKEINDHYERQKELPGFNLKEFVLSNFKLPIPHSNGYKSNTTKSVEENIETLWDVLTRQPDKEDGSLISLPFPYIVPGGRFGEIYYWDSYFTMLGLKASGRIDMIGNMINNFSYLIDILGYIPNGNRTYFIGRSQPPFYSLMIKMLAELKGDKVLVQYLPQLEKEYDYWMKGVTELQVNGSAKYHVVKMRDGEIMNRYCDANLTARPESYKEDIELAEESKQDKEMLFANLRAGAESGWDYSCRWFNDVNSFATIHTTDIVPVDLNCLLWHMEHLLSVASELKGEKEKGKNFRLLSEQRKAAIHKYCWNERAGYFTDYNWQQQHHNELLTAATTSPLFFNIATNEQAIMVANMSKEKLLQPGGLVTTTETTGQQWDAPNGWAPLQWIAITGLENYGFHELAAGIARRWIKLNTDVFKRTGKLMEKYNVVDTHLEAGGGEYSGQDGFGWTNGVLLALIKKYGAAD